MAVLGISPDRLPALQRFRHKQALAFPLLADSDQATRTVYGAFGEKQVRQEGAGRGMIRSTFIISPEGTVEKAIYNIKATGHVAKVVKELGLAA